MKKGILVILLIPFIGFGQVKEKKILDNSTIKKELILNLIKNIDSSFVFKDKKLYYDIDLKQRYISGNGTDYNPEFQDSAYSTDSVESALINESINHNHLGEIVKHVSLGKVGVYTSMYNYLVYDTLNNKYRKPGEQIYIRIQEPIDGWDIIQVLLNDNLKWLSKDGTISHLASSIYIPISINYTKEYGEILTDYWLYNYIIGFDPRKGFYCEYNNKMKLEIASVNAGQ